MSIEEVSSEDQSSEPKQLTDEELKTHIWTKKGIEIVTERTLRRRKNVLAETHVKMGTKNKHGDSVANLISLLGAHLSKAVPPDALGVSWTPVSWLAQQKINNEKRNALPPDRVEEKEEREERTLSRTNMNTAIEAIALELGVYEQMMKTYQILDTANRRSGSSVEITS